MTDEVARTFASGFERWGFFLPEEAIAQRKDGVILGQGWTIRWRWFGDTLRYLSHHRMSDDALVDIAPDGHKTVHPTPGTFYEVANPEAEERMTRAWREHEAKLEREGFRPLPAGGGQVDYDARTQWLWRVDDGDWHVEQLPEH